MKPVIMSVLLLVTLSAAVQASIQIGTGLDASGNLLAQGASEVNYTVGGNASSAWVFVAGGDAWLANMPNGQWISPYLQSTGGPSGDTTYTRKIVGAGTLELQFASDNAGQLKINGVAVAQTLGWKLGFENSFSQLVELSYVLPPGENILEFTVHNLFVGFDNPTGLIVAGTFTPVPEPTTVFAGVLLLVPLGASAIRSFLRRH
ncbi:MAG: hypothetical protein AB9869_09675 [Verrucomicrobiia bacterium]